MVAQAFDVGKRYREPLKAIPYVGCKSGFAHIFDSLVPDSCGRRIYDVFGGGGGFAFYACSRFGSGRVTYNDHNPVLANFMRALQSEPAKLCAEYGKHYERSSPDYYLSVREMDLEDGAVGAGRFFYLAKNAFSGKIRFNSKNRFNCPMRKDSRCPQLDEPYMRSLSRTISGMRIRNEDYAAYGGVRGSFVYLDPPYMNNQNGHYNATVPLADFVEFVEAVEPNNRVMISEQNSPERLGLPRSFRAYPVVLRRSLQYATQTGSREVVAINYGA